MFDVKHFTGISDEEYLNSGHLACPGCGAAMTMKLLLKALGRRTIIAAPAGCWAVCDGPFPYSASGVPYMHCAFETAAITAAGIRYALDAQKIEGVTVVAFAGDGGTFDIGIQAISGCAERNDDIIYICYDNEAYMNTGIQRSSATPKYVWTSTTPGEFLFKEQPKKMFGEIMAGHRIPYFATGTIAYPDDLTRKFIKAKQIKGFRCFHIFSPCPVGWRMEERYSVHIARLAVHCKVFPIYEVENGVKWTINIWPKGIPVNEYFQLQGRFRDLTPEQLKELQEWYDREWELLVKRTKM